MHRCFIVEDTNVADIKTGEPKNVLCSLNVKLFFCSVLKNMFKFFILFD